LEIYKILNNIKKKLKINIIAKDLLKKQIIIPICYDSKLKGLSDELTLVLSDTIELDRVPSTK